MANETTKANGRLVYIEPNDLTSKGPNGEPVDNITWNPEDLNMSVDLQVIVPSRNHTINFNVSDKTKFAINMSYGTNTDVGRFVSFMQGATIKTKNKTSVSQGELTTDYIEASYTELYKDGKSSKECLGIDSVDITFDSHFYPQVTIKFIDVRGYSLMMPSEEQYRETMLWQQGNSQGQETDAKSNTYSNFFRALFHFPYPRFLLSIKGYYGTAITFMLAVNEFKTNFNSQTGNFEVTVTFIGYMYGLYTDLPFNFLIAAPYCNGQAGETATNGYWRNENFVYDDGKNQPINTFIEFFEQFTHYQGELTDVKRGLSTYTSFPDLQKKSDQIDALNNLCSQIDDFFKNLALKTLTRDGKTNIEFKNFNDTSDYISKPCPINSNDKIKSTQMLMFGKDNEFAETWKTFVTAFNDYTKKYDDNINKGVWLPKCLYKEREWVTDIDNPYYSGCYKGRENTSKQLEELTIFKEALSQAGDDKVVFFLLPSQIKAPINQRIKALEEEKAALEHNTNVENKEIYNQNFCFDPTIVNVYRMIFAHINCFMDLFYDTIEKIKGLGRTVDMLTKVDFPQTGLTDLNKGSRGGDLVPPFPAIYKEVDNHREQVYPGEIEKLAQSNLMPEIQLVEDLITGAMGAKNKANQIILQGVEDETADRERLNNNIFTLTKISDVLYLNDGDNGMNPYGYVRIENNDNVLGEILYVFTIRLIAALAEQKPKGSFGIDYVGDIAQKEAENFLAVYQNKYDVLNKELNKTDVDYFQSLSDYLDNKKYQISNFSLRVKKTMDSEDSFFYEYGGKVCDMPLMLTGNLNYETNRSYSISKSSDLCIISTSNPRYDISNLKERSFEKLIIFPNPQDTASQKISDMFPDSILPTGEESIIKGWYMEDKINNFKNKKSKTDNIWTSKSKEIWDLDKEKDEYLFYFLYIFCFHLYLKINATIQAPRDDFSSIHVLNKVVVYLIGALLKLKEKEVKIGGEANKNVYGYLFYRGKTYDYAINCIPYNYNDYLKEQFKTSYNEFVRVDGTKIIDILRNTESYQDITKCQLKNENLIEIFKYFFNLTYGEQQIVEDKTCFIQYVTSPSLDEYISKYKLPIDVLSAFCNKIKSEYENAYGVYSEYQNQEILKSQVTNAYRLSMYNSLKNLYDKWMATYDRSSFKLNPPDIDRKIKQQRYQDGNMDINTEGANSEFNNFIFVDCFFRDISRKFYINPETLFNVIKKQMTTENNFSVYQFMAQLMQDNHMLLQALPVYNNFYNINTLEKVFKPNIKDTLKTGFGSTYVCMYTYEVSHILEDDRQSDHLADDGIDLCDITGNPRPLDGNVASMLFDKMGNSDELNITVPAFGVTYARQNQTYFTNIDVNMDNPRVTDYSIANLFSLANMTKDKEIDEAHAIGNDIYAIYANRSYNCGVEMMGCANIMPMMYFQLNNIPMFRGAYMITNVEHHIKAGDFKTIFRGVRINKNQLPYNQEALTTDNIWGYQTGEWNGPLIQYKSTSFAPTVKVVNAPNFNITNTDNSNEYHLVLWRYNKVLSRGGHYALEGVIYELDTQKILTYTIEDEYDVTRNKKTWQNGAEIDTTITPGGGTWPGQDKPYHWGCSLYCATLAQGMGGFGKQAKQPLTMLKVGNDPTTGCLFHPGADVTWSEGCVLCGEKAQNGRRNVSSVQYHMENIFSSNNNDVLWWRNIYDNVVPKICDGKKVILHVRQKFETLETSKTTTGETEQEKDTTNSSNNNLVSIMEKIGKAGLTQLVIINPIYATTNNFGNKIMPGYVSGQRDLYIGENTMKCLIKAVKYMRNKYPDKKIMIWDAYRPYEAADNFCKIAQEMGKTSWLGRYIASIPNGKHSKSPHCKGRAIDLTLCDSSGHPLRMIPDGTNYTCSWANATNGFDEFSHLAKINKEHPNQNILRDIMKNGGGFSDYDSEYWHFQTNLDNCEGTTNYK